jgi:hypothetical protein
MINFVLRDANFAQALQVAPLQTLRIVDWLSRRGGFQATC